MFPIDQPGLGKAGFIYTSLGGGTRQDGMFAEYVVSGAWDMLRMRCEAPTITDLTDRCVQNIRIIRQALAGGSPTIPSMLVFTGFTMEAGEQIQTPWGPLRPLADWERKLAPPSLGGCRYRCRTRWKASRDFLRRRSGAGHRAPVHDQDRELARPHEGSKRMADNAGSGATLTPARGCPTGRDSGDGPANRRLGDGAAFMGLDWRSLRLLRDRFRRPEVECRVHADTSVARRVLRAQPLGVAGRGRVDPPD